MTMIASLAYALSRKPRKLESATSTGHRPPHAAGNGPVNPGIKNISGGDNTESDHFTDIAAAFQR
jgi:hypothetical protein